MAALAAGNAGEHIGEIKALRREHKAAGTLEFLGPKVSEATAENPTRFKIARATPAKLAVLVELPPTYPSDAPPKFSVVDSELDAPRNDAIAELLAEQAGYMRGMTCVSTVLLALDDLDLADLDLGEPGRCRSIFTVDVVNNSPVFKKALEGAAVGNPCAYFYRTIACQNNAKFSFAVDPLRSVFVVCDAPDKKAAVAFMKTIRTDGAMDMDMLGKPGKIQMSVVEEFELAPKAPAACGGFAGTEYRTDAERAELMGPLMAEAAAVKK